MGAGAVVDADDRGADQRPNSELVDLDANTCSAPPNTEVLRERTLVAVDQPSRDHAVRGPPSNSDRGTAASG
jgi:hypothetical protein